MNVSECWDSVYKLISLGKIEEAMALCEQKPYSAIVKCQNYLAWEFYKRSEMEKSLTWFEMSADQGDGEGFFGIASVCVAKKEFRTAIDYFENATKYGYTRGFHWIAGIYQHGLGVPMDVELAIKYYRQGADHGFLIAERSLLSLTSKQGSTFVKISSFFKLIRLQIKALNIALHNIHDPRLVDVSNAFARRALP